MPPKSKKEATKAERGVGIRTILIGALADGKEHQFKELLATAREEYGKTHEMSEDKPFKIGRTLAGLKTEGLAKQVKGKRGFWQKAAGKPKKAKKEKATPAAPASPKAPEETEEEETEDDEEEEEEA